MQRSTDDTENVPDIKKVQYNVAGTEHSFEGEENVDQEHNEHINHDDWAARIVLANGNWIELRKVDDETMEECIFIQEERQDGQHEAFMHDSTEIRHIDAAEIHEFWEGVDTHIQVYQSDIQIIEALK